MFMNLVRRKKRLFTEKQQLKTDKLYLKNLQINSIYQIPDKGWGKLSEFFYVSGEVIIRDKDYFKDLLLGVRGINSSGDSCGSFAQIIDGGTFSLPVEFHPWIPYREIFTAVTREERE